MPTDTDVRVRLAEAGARRADAETRREDAMRDLAALVREAHEDGLTVVEIADLAGVSRPTVYALLRG